MSLGTLIGHPIGEECGRRILRPFGGWSASSAARLRTTLAERYVRTGPGWRDHRNFSGDLIERPAHAASRTNKFRGAEVELALVVPPNSLVLITQPLDLSVTICCKSIKLD